ncbi:PorT protein [Ichthyobacterium seriolicida]|uniref:PorT protein n=1 Tax=Ichthyobacterium seriolicida TaxID=242600 RepID=A0A1J1DY87_9FLAO|nr:PorT protein [Ichthyobacterium seriolicida]
MAQRKTPQNMPYFDFQTYHFGYYLGLNYYDFKIVPSEDDLSESGRIQIETDPTIGFDIGLLIDYRLHEFLNLRLEPGVSYTQKGFKYDKEILIKYAKLNTNVKSTDDTSRQVGLVFLNIPLILKFSSFRINNFRPYITCGISYTHNFISGENSLHDNFDNVFRVKAKDLKYEFGFGVDFYMPYFKFSLITKGIFGIFDSLVKDNPQKGRSPWTDPIESLHTRAWKVILVFE